MIIVVLKKEQCWDDYLARAKSVYIKRVQRILTERQQALAKCIKIMILDIMKQKFKQSKSCQTNLIAFFDRATRSVDKSNVKL